MQERHQKQTAYCKQDINNNTMQERHQK